MTTKIKFKVSKMNCTACAKVIDGELEDTEGIKRSNTNFEKGEAEVEFDPEKLTQNQIKEIIKKLGYEPELLN